MALHEREEYSRAVEERADAERSAAYPTPDDELAGVAEEIRGQLALQERYGMNFKQQELIAALIAITARLGQQNQNEEQHRKQVVADEEDDDQQLVFVEEGRRAQQEEMVETGQAEESQATLPLQPLINPGTLPRQTSIPPDRGG